MKWNIHPWDCEEIFADFDQKCIGLELQTTPLTQSDDVLTVGTLSHKRLACNI